MSTAAVSGNTSFIHEAAFYDLTAGLEVVIPFLEEAVEAGEPAVAALDERGNGLVRAALGEPSSVLFVDGYAQHTRPANTVKSYQELFTEQVALGARQIRVVGNVPQPGVRAPWGWWARYEAAINRLYEGFRLGDLPVRHADHAGAGAGRGDPDASLPRQGRAARAQPEV